MAKPNYSYEKRQRELAKKKKKEEKAARKANGKVEGPDPEAGSESSDMAGDALAPAADGDSPTVEPAAAPGPGAA